MINTLKPFDKVLVRMANINRWQCSLFSHFNPTSKEYVCVFGEWKQCVPYNEETKHLVGTNNPCPEQQQNVWRVTNNGISYLLTEKEFNNFLKDIQGGKAVWTIQYIK